MRFLAVDYGERRIGLAVSDETGSFASPLSTRERKGRQHDIAAVVETMRGVGAEAVVMGLPRGLDRTEGQHEAAARKFAAALAQGLRAAGLTADIEWWDERFSTREALVHMRLAGVSQRKARASSGGGSVDARAAAIILQGFLDFRKSQAQRAATDAASSETGSSDSAAADDGPHRDAGTWEDQGDL